jgi:tape measure domain-containing protein
VFGGGGSIGDAFITVRPDTSGFQSSAERSIVPGFVKLGGAIALGFGAYKAVDFAKSAIIDFNSQLQQSKVAFSTLEHSSKKGGEALHQVVKFAQQTPFELQQILPVAQQLLGTGTKLGDLTPVMTKLGDAVAATGGSSAQLSLLTTAYTQVTTAGTAHMQDLLQINNAVPGSLAKIAAAMDMPIGKFRQAVADSKISSAEAKKAILEAFGTSFQGAMVRQSGTFAGAMSNVHDSLQGVIATAGRPLFNAFSQGANAFASFLMHGGKAQAIARQVGSGLQTVITGAEGLAHAFGPQILSFFEGSLSRISALVSGTLIPTFERIAPQVLPLIMSVADVFTQTIEPAISSAMQQIIPLFGQLLQALAPMAPFITNVIAPVLQGVLIGVVGSIVATLKILIPIVSIVAKVLGRIGTAAAPLRPILVKVGEVIGFLLGPAMIGAAAKSAKFLGMIERFGGVFGRAVTFVLRFVARVNDLFASMAEKVIGLAGRIFSAVINKFSGLASSISGLVGRFLSIATRIGESLLNPIQRYMGRVVSFARGIGGRILGAVGNLGRTLYNAGIQLIAGLLSGITDKFHDVTNFAGSIAGKISSIKGPLDYDRVLLIPHGRAIMAGLEQGLLSGQADVLRAASRVAPAISRAVAPGGAGLGAPALAGAGAVRGGHTFSFGDVTVVSPGYDAEAIAESLMDSVARRVRSIG